jgi:hypothetical protein
MVNEPQLSLVTTTREPEKVSQGNLRRTITIGIVALFVVLVLLFAIVVALSIFGGDSFAGAVRVVRDLVIIFMALEGAMIILALAILILQIARLVNLVQTEVKPMLENTQATITTVRGTVEFMSENLTEPIVRASGFLAGASILTRNLFGIRKALKRAGEENEPNET